jgi:hypothetical protein
MNTDLAELPSSSNDHGGDLNDVATKIALRAATTDATD